MAQEGHITEAMAKVALAQPAAGGQRERRGSVNYAADYVMDVLDDTSARSTRTSSSPRRSTRDAGAAERALTEELDKKGAKFDVSQGALVALDPERRDPRAGRRPQLRRQPVQPRRRRASGSPARPSSRSSI